MPEAISKLESEVDALSSQEERLRRIIKEEKSKLTNAEKLISLIEAAYLDALIQVGVPGIQGEDKIYINRKTWLPSILPGGDLSLKYDFYNAGSGGKKTLLNICYALAVHKVAAEQNLPLPNFLIIDTPMKNIGEDVNEDIFVAFYRYLYSLVSGTLSNTQIIIIDKEFIEPEQPINIFNVFMTPSDPEHPPLIPYYHGP